jgi:hypothetical protein
VALPEARAAASPLKIADVPDGFFEDYSAERQRNQARMLIEREKARQDEEAAAQKAQADREWREGSTLGGFLSRR